MRKNLITLFLIGCSSPKLGTAKNPNSVLSTVVSVDVPGASAARVITAEGAKTFYTPYVPLDDGKATITVLGLNAQTAYSHVVESLSGSGVKSSAALHAMTDALPKDLANVKFAITNGTGAPERGYFLFSGFGNATFATDEEGTLRWYRDFGATNEETKMQKDGTFTTFVGASEGFQATEGQYERYTADGANIANYAVKSPDTDGTAIYTDNHELLITTDNSGAEHLHLIAYELRPQSDGSLAAWHMLVRQDDSANVELRWNSWDYFAASDTNETVPGGTDIDHGNALFIDPTDGNYVMSFRDTDAVLKINYNSGNVLWQLGGKKNQFTFIGDPLNGFWGQHCVTPLPNGDVLLYDDGLGHSPPESRAVEYKLDTTAMTATMVWEYRHDPAIFTFATGSVQRLENGNTLVGFAYAGVLDEVDENGALVWEGVLTNGGSVMQGYRMMRLASLYGYAPP